MKLHIVFLAAALGLATTAFGATPAPAAGTGMGPAGHHDFCQQNAQECKDQAAKFDQWCSANADKCVKLKAFVEKRREACEQDKPKCEERMHNMHEHMVQMCAKNPDNAHCKAMNGKQGANDDQDNQGDDDDASSPPK